MRTGVVTKKLGMSIFFDKQGNRLPVTLLKLDDCQVVGHRNKEKDGVVAVRIGYGNVKANKITKPLKGYFLKNKVDFKKNVADFKVSEDALLDIGTYVNADHYVVGQFIDVTGISTGKGFAGVMKRHGFSGLRASHGVSVSHRSHGSTGQCQDPGKVFKGKKMAGHMGCKRVTTSNLEIIEIDKENNILIVKGAVPGVENAYVLVKDAKKRGLPPNVPYPAVKAGQEEKTEKDETISSDTPDEVKENHKKDKSVDSTSVAKSELQEISKTTEIKSEGGTTETVEKEKVENKLQVKPEENKPEENKPEENKPEEKSENK